MRIWIAVSLVTACGSVNESPTDAAPVDQGIASDAPGTQARCDPGKPFGKPTVVENINSSLDEHAFSLTRDEKIGFVSRSAQGMSVILATQRGSATAAFDVPSTTLTSAINDVAGEEYAPVAGSDGLTLYFHRQTQSQNDNGIGILAATRTSAGASLDAGAGVSVGGSGLLDALSPTISADGQTLYWLDFTDFGKVFAATRSNGATLFGPRRAASSIAIAGPPILSADELTMFYAEGNGDDVLVSTRASKTALFGPGVPVPEVNSDTNDVPTALTHDGCVLYISSQRPDGLGGYDIWEARRPL